MPLVWLTGVLARRFFGVAIRLRSSMMAATVPARTRVGRCGRGYYLPMALVIATSDMQPRRGMANGGHSTQQADDNWSDERSHRGHSGREYRR